jgi:hypothetical protein
MFNLGTANEAAPQSSDPDYDDAEIITRALHLKKLGVTFKNLLLFSQKCSQPLNWRAAPELGFLTANSPRCEYFVPAEMRRACTSSGSKEAFQDSLFL